MTKSSPSSPQWHSLMLPGHDLNHPWACNIVLGTGVIKQGRLFTLHRFIGWRYEWPLHMQYYLLLLGSCSISCFSEEVTALTFTVLAESMNLEPAGWVPFMWQSQEAPLYHWMCGQYSCRVISMWSLHTWVSMTGWFSPWWMQFWATQK